MKLSEGMLVRWPFAKVPATEPGKAITATRGKAAFLGGAKYEGPWETLYCVDKVEKVEGPYVWVAGYRVKAEECLVLTGDV